MTYYTARQGKNGIFMISKLNNDLEVEGFYYLNKRGNAWTCTCPNHAAWCKHMDILEVFINEDKINKGWFLDSKNQWYEPVKYEV